jgi:superfamily I DNA and/or RNA helicase
LRSKRYQWARTVDSDALDKWLKNSIGTVHTFQGREAETVVFVLGGSSSGAIRWAASTPNILNVGVTRAQRRLYVVGDWNEWMKVPLVKRTMSIDGWRISPQAAFARMKEPSSAA